MKLTKAEWQDSQKGELEYWRQQTHDNNPEQRARWLWYWTVCFRGYFESRNLRAARLLDYGSGPQGILHHIETPQGIRVAFDPLMDEYARLGFPVNDRGVQPLAIWPAWPEHFDIVFCLNVLDHTADPVSALQDIHHTLRSNGELVLCCDMRPTERLDACHKLQITEAWLESALCLVGFGGRHWIVPHQAPNPTKQFCGVFIKTKGRE